MLESCLGFLRRRLCGVPCEENTRVLHELCADMNYSAVDYELKVNESATSIK